MMVVDGDIISPLMKGHPEYTCRQHAPKVYRENAAVYAMKYDTLMVHGSIYGNVCRAVIMSRERSINIDSELEFAYAEFLLSRDIVRV